MKKRLWFILALTFIAAAQAAAQVRTVTNADLEKFRQTRLAALKDYRENYERLGFPSPEELDRQIEQNRVERAELAARLREENLERARLGLEQQRIDLDRQIAEAEAQRLNNSQSPTGNYPFGANNSFFNYGYTPFGNNFPSFGGFGFPGYNFPNGQLNRRNRGNFRFNNQPRIEYRNNLPVLIPPPGRRIFAPRQTGGRRN